jgi:hypothetical protein
MVVETSKKENGEKIQDALTTTFFNITCPTSASREATKTGNELNMFLAQGCPERETQLRQPQMLLCCMVFELRANYVARIAQGKVPQTICA